MTRSNTWSLEEIYYNGQVYWLDPRTNRVYLDHAQGGWPELVGQWDPATRRVKEMQKSQAVALFDTLDRYLKENRMRAREVFDHFDQQRRGWLKPDELGRLIQHFLPHVSKGDLKYFQVMIDANGDGKIEYEEFLNAAREARDDEQRAAQRTLEVTDVLQRLSDYMRNDETDFYRQFSRFDVNNNGVLDPTEVAMLLKAAMPALTPQQLRYILAHLKQYDLDGDGCLSAKEILVAMRAVNVSLSRRGGAVESVNRDRAWGRSSSMHISRVSAPGAGMDDDAIAGASNVGRIGGGGSQGGRRRGGSEWVLEDYPYRGQTLLYDPLTRLVYRPPSDGSGWPELYGKVDTDGRLMGVTRPKPRDLFERLDRHLKDTRTLLSDVSVASTTTAH